MSDANLDDSSVAQAEAQEEEEVAEDQEQEDFEEDQPYTNSEEEVTEEKRARQRPRQETQDIPGEHISRQEKRTVTREQGKPLPTRNNNGNDRRIRMPQESPVDSNIEKYSEVDNPSAQILPPGEEPSRAAQLFNAGELQGIGRKALIRAASRMQAYRTAFIEWQSQRDDYKIFQNTGTDPDTGKDIWAPVTYQLHFLTVSQEEKLRDMNATLADLQRAQQNNDQSITAVNTKIRKVQKAILRYKLRTYFRFLIDEDPDTNEVGPDDELHRASSVDVRDMVDSAEWAFQWVPKSRRIKPSEVSGSRRENEFAMIR